MYICMAVNSCKIYIIDMRVVYEYFVSYIYKKSAFSYCMYSTKQNTEQL